MADNADCTKTLRDVGGAGFLTGFSRRALAALIHLRDAWCVADATNAPGIEVAMRAILNTRSMSERLDELKPFVVHTLDEGQAALLWRRITVGTPR